MGTLKGSTTVTVEYKDANGKVVFTKTISVTATDFDTEVAKWDLVVTSENNLLDADDDTNEQGADVDDAVTFKLNQLDKNGNIIGTETLDGTAAELTFTASTAKDTQYIDTITYPGNVGTVAFTSDAALKLVNSGTLKVSAKVGRVTVDTENITYKNTDSVASKAVVNTEDRIVDLSNQGGISINTNDLLFGKVNTARTGYALKPVVTIQDQSGTTMNYNFLTAVDKLYNGLTVDVGTPVVTNKNNVTIDGNDDISLTDDSKSGSLTIVIPSVNTVDGTSANVNTDLLAAPVSINVTLVNNLNLDYSVKKRPA